MILATSAFLVAALAQDTAALTGNEDICRSIVERIACKDECEVKEKWSLFFDDWECQLAGKKEAEEEADEEEADENHGDVCNEHWEEEASCIADESNKCVFIPSGWFSYSECRTEACDIYQFNEEGCLASTVGYGCEWTPESFFYTSGCDDNPAPTVAGTDATEEEYPEEVDEEEADDGDVCNEHWEDEASCIADESNKCVFIPSTGWFSYSECRTEACDIYQFDEEGCLASTVGYGCQWTPESLFYTSGCDANLAPTCQNLEGEFDHPSTAVCSCGEFEVPIGTLACFAEPEIYVTTCEDYMDLDNSDDACAASKVCKLAEQGWAASWFFVRECIPKETAEILEVETVTDVKNDANGVDVEVEGFKKAPSSRSSKKPLSSVAATVVLGKGKNCGILPCFVFEYKFYFIGGLGAISALLLMLIAIKCCSRRRAKE